MLPSNEAAVNRRFIYSVAHTPNVRYLDDPGGPRWQSRDAGQRARAAASRRDPQEAGGFDSSYRGVSLYITPVVYLGLSPPDPQRSTPWRTIERAEQSECLAIDTTGRLSTAVNSRLSSGSERLLGITEVR